MTRLPLDRLAGAPISWGVCEVPGWGVQPPPAQVLDELAGVGLRALELGPDGFLPTDPTALRGLLDGRGLRLVGGFVPVVLHRPEQAAAAQAELRRASALLGAAGADVVVLAATAAEAGYDRPRRLADEEWDTLVTALDEASRTAVASGLRLVLHPHVGTVVEGPEDVRRILERTSVPLCLDTGHLLIGGVDPVELARAAPERIGHVHLKDVDAALAAEVRSGRTSYGDAVADGLYRPLGAGDVRIAEVVDTLERGGYRGWYVLEQDVRLDREAAGGEGPVGDVRTSVAFLTGSQRPAHPTGALAGERGRD
ncbi:MAG: Inosose dehydratase [uncultured Thermoleophilia bacterium]|uniref:Inosose dehydratase n=1 Tax=uncultured Thermoleophilia bacterium TaxID=1497501 RepID=A0A6J4TEQ4_9ACTN|nr:MAG: Inosose dehydratase [uncultured Thermoleophilia bacterium]